MDKKLLEKCELFDKNNNILFKKYWLNFESIIAVASFIFTDNNMLADVDKLDAAKEIISDKFGLLSTARGSLQVPLMANMVMSNHQEQYLDDVNDIYQKLVNNKLFHSDFELLAAIVINGQRNNIDVDETIEKINKIYKSMKDNHPLLTDEGDLTSATMFALCEKDNDELIDEMEECYKILKKQLGLFSGETAQTTSAILSIIDKQVEEKCQKVMDIINELKSRKISIKHSMSCPIIAGLVAIDKSVNQICDEIEEVFNWLKGKKGFGVFELGKEGRIIYAIMLTLDYNIDDSMLTCKLVESTLTSIALVEVMVIMMIIITTSIASSSSNSN